MWTGSRCACDRWAVSSSQVLFSPSLLSLSSSSQRNHCPPVPVPKNSELGKNLHKFEIGTQSLIIESSCHIAHITAFPHMALLIGSSLNHRNNRSNNVDHQSRKPTVRTNHTGHLRSGRDQVTVMRMIAGVPLLQARRHLWLPRSPSLTLAIAPWLRHP